VDSGAHFHKSDLQTHSPRDPSWSGTKPTTDDDRRAYAQQFVAACRAKGLDAVAVTDHHDLAFVDYIRDAAAAETDDGGNVLPEQRRLVVFPGVELSLGVPCQALLILYADFPSDRLPGVLAALSIDATDPKAASHQAPQQLSHVQDFKSLYDLLDRNAWLKGRYAVFPHASDGGHKTLIRKGLHDKYKDMPCVGVYTDGAMKKLGEGSTKILAGEDKAWGNKRVAIVQTSDSRSDTFAELGKCPTWIKWAIPTAEALRQACLAQESRISQSVPALPNIALTRLSVSNSRYMGPVELELNPQYNAIIGGRGTGKSTCLEYIRWALCDQPPLATAADDLPDYASRRGRLIDETLRPMKSTVDVHFSINAIPHVVRRYSETDEVVLKVGDGEFEASKPEDIRSLLPIQAYSQRQLSSVAVRLDEITRFVTAPVRVQLADLEANATAISARIRENYATLQRHRALTSAIARDEIELRSLEEQATNLRTSLPDLSAEDQELLARKPAFDAVDELVTSWEADLSAASVAITDARAEVEALIGGLASVAEEVPERETVSALEKAVREALSEAKETLVQAEQDLHSSRAPANAIARNVEKWRKALQHFETAYTSAKKRSAAHESQLEALAALERRQRELRQQLASQREELKRIGDPAARHTELRDEWLSVQRERSDLLSEQCEGLTRLSNGLIRARLGRGTEFEPLSQRFKAAITGSGIRANKIEAIFERVAEAQDTLDAWIETTDELERVLLAGDDAGTKKWTPRSALAVLSSTELEKIRAKLTQEDVLEMSLATPGDRPSFEYRIRENEYIAFEVASAGQQATALLRVLLNQPGPSLIIDQPEDDLDSQVIIDVVDEIWQSKMKRQLIFSSHNANLVVNGDAELVVCCDYRAAGDQSRGQIKLTGAIDIPNVRAEITTVMEGGEKAFRLRKEKYGF
jgi:chromosome segregation protein